MLNRYGYLRQRFWFVRKSISLASKTGLEVQSSITMFSIFIWPILSFSFTLIPEETQGRFCSCCCTCERNFVFPLVLCGFRVKILCTTGNLWWKLFQCVELLRDILSCFFWSAFTIRGISNCQLKLIRNGNNSSSQGIRIRSISKCQETVPEVIMWVSVYIDMLPYLFLISLKYV